jgi:hypothetical protein
MTRLGHCAPGPERGLPPARSMIAAPAGAAAATIRFSGQQPDAHNDPD